MNIVGFQEFVCVARTAASGARCCLSGNFGGYFTFSDQFAIVNAGTRPLPQLSFRIRLHVAIKSLILDQKAEVTIFLC